MEKIKLVILIIFFFAVFSSSVSAQTKLLGWDSDTYANGCWAYPSTSISNYNWKASRLRADNSGTISYFKLRVNNFPTGCTNDNGCWAIYEDSGSSASVGSLKAYGCFSSHNWTTIGTGNHTFPITNIVTNSTITAGNYYSLVFYSTAIDNTHYANVGCSAPIYQYRGRSQANCIGTLNGMIDVNYSSFPPPPAGSAYNIPVASYFAWSLWSVGTPDTQAPTTPTNLSATAVSSSQINLNWTASTDNVGVTGYRIYRGDTQVGTSGTNSYSDTGLSASTTYSYTVAAYDAALNISNQSSLASATTQAAPSGGLGLIGYWKFDENSGTTAYDSSGNNNTATLINGPVWTVGKLGQALNFNYGGTADYVRIPNMIAGLSAMTFSVWVKAKVADTATSRIIIDQSTGAPDSIYLDRTSGEAYRLKLSNDNQTSSVVTSATFRDTDWHHIVGRYDGAEVDMFVDGSIVNSSNPLTGVIETTPADNLTISDNYSTSEWDGLIDEVRVYNRALSASEIQALFTGASDTTSPSAPTGGTIQ